MDLARESGHDDIIALLEPYAKDNDGRTALMNATFNGDYGMAELLIQNNADVNAKDNSGGTALIYAAPRGYHEIAELLIQNKADVNAKTNDGWTALMYAATNGHYEMTNNLLQSNADVNAKLNDGITVEFYSAERGFYELSIDGWTALDFAREEGHDNIVDLLKSKNNAGFLHLFELSCQLIYDKMKEIIPARFLKIF